MTGWPSGTLASTASATGTRATVETVRSSITGGMRGGGSRLTTVVTDADAEVPSLLVGSGSGIDEVDDTTSVSEPDAGALPLRLNVSVEPTATVPMLQTACPFATVPPTASGDPSSGGSRSVSTTSAAGSGPKFVTVRV